MTKYKDIGNLAFVSLFQAFPIKELQVPHHSVTISDNDRTAKSPRRNLCKKQHPSYFGQRSMEMSQILDFHPSKTEALS